MGPTFNLGSSGWAVCNAELLSSPTVYKCTLNLRQLILTPNVISLHSFHIYTAFTVMKINLKSWKNQGDPLIILYEA